MRTLIHSLGNASGGLRRTLPEALFRSIGDSGSCHRRTFLDILRGLDRQPNSFYIPGRNLRLLPALKGLVYLQPDVVHSYQNNGLSHNLHPARSIENIAWAVNPNMNMHTSTNSPIATVCRKLISNNIVTYLSKHCDCSGLTEGRGIPSPSIVPHYP